MDTICHPPKGTPTHFTWGCLTPKPAAPGRLAGPLLEGGDGAAEGAGGDIEGDGESAPGIKHLTAGSSHKYQESIQQHVRTRCCILQLQRDPVQPSLAAGLSCPPWRT